MPNPSIPETPGSITDEIPTFIVRAWFRTANQKPEVYQCDSYLEALSRGLLLVTTNHYMSIDIVYPRTATMVATFNGMHDSFPYHG